MTTDTISNFEISNTCTCTVYDEETGEWTDTPSEYCYGDCWEDQVYFFGLCIEKLLDNNETGWWKVSGLKLWDRAVGGYFRATELKDILRGMTVNSAWTMRGQVFEDRIEYSLSHPDAPMGSSSVLLPVSEEERENSGLY